MTGLHGRVTLVSRRSKLRLLLLVMGIYLNDTWEEDPPLTELVEASFGVPTVAAWEALLVLIALSGYSSYEEIYSVFGHLPGIYRSKVIPKLTKDGYIRSFRFDRPDGACYTCFTITNKGLNKAFELGALRYVSKVPKRANSHSYAISYNLYQCIRFMMPFTWVMEAPYDNPYKEGLDFRSELGFRTDCNAIFDERIVHIEEDRASENTQILWEKLYNYRDKGCLEDPNEMIIFSVRATGVSVPAVADAASDYIYSAAKCKDLLGCIRAQGIDDASMLIGHREIFKNQSYLDALIKKVGRVDLAFLEGFYKTLHGGISPMQMEDFNIKHQSMALTLMSYIAKRMEPDDLFYDIIRGYVVGFIPTSLISSRLPFLMLSRFPDKRVWITSVLERYFGTVAYEGELSDIQYIAPYNNTFIMRNSFSHSNGHVFVEFPSMDLGAWVRCKTFTAHMEELNGQVVCVFDTIAEAKKFFVFCDYDARTLTLDTCNPSLYGLIMGEDRLFVASGSGDDRYTPFIAPGH